MRVSHARNIRATGYRLGRFILTEIIFHKFLYSHSRANEKNVQKVRRVKSFNTMICNAMTRKVEKKQKIVRLAFN